MSTIRARAKAIDGVVEVKLLMKHPMHTGLGKDSDGQPIAANFIQTVEVSVAGKAVFNAMFNTSVSKDPYLKFKYAGASGDEIAVKWVDNQGQSDSDSFTVK